MAEAEEILCEADLLWMRCSFKLLDIFNEIAVTGPKILKVIDGYAGADSETFSSGEILYAFRACKQSRVLVRANEGLRFSLPPKQSFNITIPSLSGVQMNLPMMYDQLMDPNSSLKIPLRIIVNCSNKSNARNRQPDYESFPFNQEVELINIYEQLFLICFTGGRSNIQDIILPVNVDLTLDVAIGSCCGQRQWQHLQKLLEEQRKINIPHRQRWVMKFVNGITQITSSGALLPPGSTRTNAMTKMSVLVKAEGDCEQILLTNALCPKIPVNQRSPKAANSQASVKNQAAHRRPESDPRKSRTTTNAQNTQLSTQYPNVPSQAGQFVDSEDYETLNFENCNDQNKSWLPRPPPIDGLRNSALDLNLIEKQQKFMEENVKCNENILERKEFNRELISVLQQRGLPSECPITKKKVDINLSGSHSCTDEIHIDDQMDDWELSDKCRNISPVETHQRVVPRPYPPISEDDRFEANSQAVENTCRNSFDQKKKENWTAGSSPADNAIDIEQLGISDVSKLLKELNLSKYIPSMEASMIDGVMLKLLREEELLKYFQFSSVECKRLHMAVHSGWRPKK